MTTEAFHLNLLQPAEHVSSSPVRLRVILPLLAFFAGVGMVIWWGSLFAQRMLVQAKLKSLAAENATRNAAESDAKAQHAAYLERSARLRQLDGYAASVRHIGPALAALAENMPVGIQLLDLSISEPPPQNLQPADRRLPPFRGPTNVVEQQTLSLDGRTAKPLYAGQLKRTLSDPMFAPLAASLVNERSRLDTSAPVKRHETRPTLFHFEYAMPERSFAAPKEVTAK